MSQQTARITRCPHLPGRAIDVHAHLMVGAIRPQRKNRMKFNNRLVRAISIPAVVLGIGIATVTSASAAMPNEESTLHPQMAGGQEILYRGGNEAYAEDGSNNHVMAWRGSDNNQVWVSFNNGNAFTITDTTGTQAPPEVAYIGNGAFGVFHTGAGGQIYWTRVYSNGSHDPGWTAIPNAVTPESFSPTASYSMMGDGTTLMAWRGMSDNRVYEASWNGYSWSSPLAVPAGSSASGYITTNYAPALTFQPGTGHDVLAHTGTDGHVYTQIRYGTDVYTYPTTHGGDAISSPAVAAMDNGHIALAVTGTDQHVWNQESDSNGTSYSGLAWSQETSGNVTSTSYPPQMTRVRNLGSRIYLGQAQLIDHNRAAWVFKQDFVE
ncbi:hypothetical protein [Streptomyces griseoluteus]|uniref:hypothetical protein n=1 Tax=Streptomyces griseoluteus TaxID=29306 RepID=UPI003820C647